MIKRFVKKILPKFIIKEIIKLKCKDLINEINSLKIEAYGVENQIPWVKVKKGYFFYGLYPNETEINLFNNISSKLQKIDIKCFGVILEIISRYNVPRSIPGETVNNFFKYDLQRDPINDFNFTPKTRLYLAEIFKPMPGDTVVDIGVLHGFGTMRLRDYIGKDGKIYAFEANPISLKILKKNIKKNDLNNIIIIPKGVSNYNRKNVSFFTDSEPSGNSLQKKVLIDLNVKNIQKIQVDVVKGDTFLKKHGIKQINYLSITVNGGEPEVLLGLKKTIENSKNIKITMPGWYYRDGKKLSKMLVKILDSFNFTNLKEGKKGRVIAWKN